MAELISSPFRSPAPLPMEDWYSIRADSRRPNAVLTADRPHRSIADCVSAANPIRWQQEERNQLITGVGESVRPSP